MQLLDNLEIFTISVNSASESRMRKYKPTPKAAQSRFWSYTFLRQAVMVWNVVLPSSELYTRRTLSSQQPFKKQLTYFVPN